MTFLKIGLLLIAVTSFQPLVIHKAHAHPHPEHPHYDNERDSRIKALDVAKITECPNFSKKLEIANKGFIHYKCDESYAYIRVE